MARLPKEVIEAIDKQDAFPVATCSSEGMPNVVYITYLKVINDETVLIADNYLHKTRQNILQHPKIAFVVRDEKKGSFQVKGSIQRLTSGPLFQEVQNWVPNKHPRKAAVVLQVEEVYNGADRLI